MRWSSCATGARREPNTARDRRELFDGLEAHSQNRWPSLRFDVGAINSLLVAAVRRGLLLQDLHVARGVVGEGLRADHPARSGPGSRESCSRSGLLREGACILRRAHRRRRPGRACPQRLSAGRAGARVILCDEDFLLGGRLNGDRREIDGVGGSDVGAPGRDRACFDCRTCACCLGRRCSVCMTAARSARSSAWPIISLVPAAQSAAAALVEDCRQARRARDRCDRAADRLRRQRPSRRDDGIGACARYLNRFGCRTGRRAAIFTTTDDGWSTAFDLAERRRDSRCHRRCRGRCRTRCCSPRRSAPMHGCSCWEHK